MPRLPNIIFAAISVLHFAASTPSRAASGTWSLFASPSGWNASQVMYDSADGTLWAIGATLKNSVLTPHIASTSLSGAPLFVEASNNNLTNATNDLLVTGLFINKFGDPMARTLRAANNLNYTLLGPHLYAYDSSANSWSPSVTPTNEQNNWNGGPGVVIDDFGEFVACGNTLVLQSTTGATWNTKADLRNYIFAPPPYTNVGVAAGKPSWIEVPTYITNLPHPNPDGFDWVTGMARMPWGEIFIGGESGSYVHSLDNGQTWEWFDPCMSVPVRDMQGTPMYPNPGCYRTSKTFDAVATKDGEVMFNCQRNDGHHFFIWTSAGNVVEAGQGLPTGAVFPDVCTKFATVNASGDTFMSVVWSNYSGGVDPTIDLSPPSPTHHGWDLFKWDGTSWTIITADVNALGWRIGNPGTVATDGQSLFLPTVTGEDQSIRKWTPDLSDGGPPAVFVVGGFSATLCPSATINATTGRASVALTGSVASANTATMQWSARGPGAVVFDDPNALSPTAWFAVPGNYVLNLRAKDTVNNHSAGGSVIVHVLPAPSGTPPTITTQPQNQLGVTSGTGAATFTVQASGTGPFKYQWKRNGIDIAGNATAQTSNLTITTKIADDGSAYHCVVSSAWGSAVSNCGTLGTAPVILANPVNQVVASGGYAVFSVSATGTQRFQWQWLRNNVPITTGSAESHNAGSFATNIPGSYKVVVSNLFGSTTSAAATLSVGTPPATFNLVMNAVASPSTSGGDATSEDSKYVSAAYPINTNIPVGVEINPSGGSNYLFEKWTATSGGTFANAFAAQSTVRSATAGSTVVLTPSYKDTIALPLYFLNVVNGVGSGVGRASVFGSSTTPVTMNITSAPPPPGLRFDHWTGAGIADVNASTTTVTLTNPNAETMVTAHFILSQFTLWQQQVFGTNASDPGTAGDSADPDHDGLPNLAEYAINSNPLDHSSGRSSLATDVETVGASKYLRLTIPKNSAANDVVYTVQVSPDLRTWDNVPTVVEVNNSSTLQVRDATAISGASRRFIRLLVTRK